MDEVRSNVRLDPAVTLTARPPERLFHLVFESHDGRALGAESEEKREPVSDIDTGVVDSLKALDPDGRLEKRKSTGGLAMWHVANSGHVADSPYRGFVRRNIPSLR